MNLNWAEISKDLALAVIALTLFGALYNVAIERVPWLAQRRSAEQVIFGVLVTVLTSGFVIGWDHIIPLLILFAASGLPMLIGSWVRAARDDEEARRIAKEALQ
jgi:hypothetical protein